MAGHSRSKNGVASLAYVPAIHALLSAVQDVDARDKRGHDVQPSLMLANLTTFAHFSVSSARNLPNSAAVMGAGE
jgi:hypothetical protein